METNTSQFEEELMIQPEFIVDENFDYNELAFDEINRIEKEKVEKFESEFESITDVIEKQKLSLDWKELENNANEQQVVLKKGSRELICKNLDGNEISFTEQLTGSQYEQEHLELLNDLYEKGYAFSSLVDTLSGKEFITAYFADEKGNVTTASFERDFEKPEHEFDLEENEIDEFEYHNNTTKIELSPINIDETQTTLTKESKKESSTAFSIEQTDDQEFTETYNEVLESFIEADENDKDKIVLPQKPEVLKIFVPNLEPSKTEVIKTEELKVEENPIKANSPSIFDLFKLNFEPVKKEQSAESKTRIQESSKTQEIKIEFQTPQEITKQNQTEISNNLIIENQTFTKPLIIKETTQAFKKVTTPKLVSSLDKVFKAENLIVTEISNPKLETLKEINPENHSGIYLEIIKPKEEITKQNLEIGTITQEQIVEKVVKNIETNFKEEKVKQQTPKVNKEIAIKAVKKNEPILKEPEVTISLEEKNNLKIIGNVTSQETNIDTKKISEKIIESTDSEVINIKDDINTEPQLEEGNSEPEYFEVEKESKIELVTEAIVQSENIVKIVPTNKTIPLRNNASESLFRNSSLTGASVITDENLLEELNGIKIESLTA